jgi:S1-C subfamily serine protease
MGSGHVEGGNGIPHQLKDLGIAEPVSLIPVAVDGACKLVGTPYADAVFTVPQSQQAPPPQPPRLGVVLMPGDGAPSINRVVNNSVAATTGLKAGDLVVRAAGLDIRTPDDLVETIARQGPGTWLPLTIKRDGQEIELIAKFPPRAAAEH